MHLLKFVLLGCEAALILVVELLDLLELLLELGELRLQARLLLDLRLLVGIELACSQQLVERLARVLGEDGISLGAGGLRSRGSVSLSAKSFFIHRDRSVLRYGWGCVG